MSYKVAGLQYLNILCKCLHQFTLLCRDVFVRKVVLLVSFDTNTVNHCYWLIKAQFCLQTIHS